MRTRRLGRLSAVGLLVVGCDGGTGPESTPAPPENVVGPDGGTVTVENLTLDVPSGALSADVEITVQRITPASAAAPDDYLVVEGTAFALGPDGLTFASPAELTIGYQASSLPAGVAPEELLVLHRSGQVEPLETVVDAGSGLVRASLQHFSDVVVGLPAGPYQRVACPDLSPAASAAAPLAAVPLGTVPSSFEPPLLARVEAVGEGEQPHSFSLVRLDEASGEAELVAPIHPTGAPVGGETRVMVTDGAVACAPFDLTIEALEPAPGELQSVASLLQGILTEQATVLGTTPEEIVATPVDRMPPALYPLALAQNALDHPQNEQSFAAIAQGARPDGTDTRLDLVEPLLARTGLRGELTTALARLRASRDRSPDGASRRTPSRVIEVGFCTPEIIGDDAGLLDHCMGIASDAAFERGNPTGQIVQDLNSAFGVLGLAPGVAGAAGDVLAFATWLYLNQQSRNAALLPSFLTGMELDADPVEFLEDQEGKGRWNASLTAANSGWDMGREILEGLLQAGQIARTFDKAEVAGPEVPDLLNYILNGPVANELLDAGAAENFQIETQTFGPVFVTPEEWTESRIALGTAVERTSHREYEPREVGSATLAVRTLPGRFGGQQGTADAEITVKQLLITISPEEVNLKAGEPQDFTVRVRDSAHPDMIGLDPSVSLQGTVGDITYLGEGLHSVPYTAPPEPDFDDPDLLTVRHTAETGARGHTDADRKAIATIRFGSVTISGGQPCVEPGESTVPFTAEVQGLDDESVIWTASAGDIDESGVYTAPPEAPAGRVVTITATSAVEPTVSDEVTIQVGGCDRCRYDLTVSGGFSGVAQGPAGFGFDGSLLEIVLDSDLVQDAPGDRIHSGFAAPWDGETGTFTVISGDVVNRSTDDWGLYIPGDQVADCATCGGTVTIDTATEEVIEGSLEVTLPTLAPDPSLPPIVARATFRASLATPDPVDRDAFSICVGEWR